MTLELSRIGPLDFLQQSEVVNTSYNDFLYGGIKREPLETEQLSVNPDSLPASPSGVNSEKSESDTKRSDSPSHTKLPRLSPVNLLNTQKRKVKDLYSKSVKPNSADRQSKRLQTKAAGNCGRLKTVQAVLDNRAASDEEVEVVSSPPVSKSKSKSKCRTSKPTSNLPRENEELREGFLQKLLETQQQIEEFQVSIDTRLDEHEAILKDANAVRDAEISHTLQDTINSQNTMITSLNKKNELLLTKVSQLEDGIKGKTKEIVELKEELDKHKAEVIIFRNTSNDCSAKIQLIINYLLNQNAILRTPPASPTNLMGTTLSSFTAPSMAISPLAMANNAHPLQILLASIQQSSSIIPK